MALRRGPDSHAYLVGGGIAALAAAAYLIRDAGLPGSAITILEETDRAGGSLDGAGSPERGYVIRGDRMMNTPAYTCTYDLLGGVPSLTDPARTVLDEIQEFNRTITTHSRARLVERGQRLDLTSPGFNWRDRYDLLAVMARSERSLGTLRIDECFTPRFFETTFWYLWCTTFAFEPWHSAVEFKRYLHRFIHEFAQINTLAGVARTPYNQYDSIVAPLLEWLRARGVRLDAGCRVTDLDLDISGRAKTVRQIHCVRAGVPDQIPVRDTDAVLVTLGSMTDSSTLGSSTSPAPRITEPTGGAWPLWEALAKKSPDFGRPATFDGRTDESTWLSFTATFRDPTFFRLMEEFSGNTPGTGALVTLKDSSWLMSVVLAHQPHFTGQPADVTVCWGYGLFPENIGNIVAKRMVDCTGDELLTELCSHLGFTEELPRILATSTTIPCLMPFITSQFLTRRQGDRPPVVPTGSTNLGFLGQFCEIPDDVVFTVEYSVRSAQIAVRGLFGIDRPISPIYRGDRDPKVLLAAGRTMFA